jgi:hypothetical protein
METTDTSLPPAKQSDFEKSITTAGDPKDDITEASNFSSLMNESPEKTERLILLEKLTEKRLNLEKCQQEPLTEAWITIALTEKEDQKAKALAAHQEKAKLKEQQIPSNKAQKKQEEEDKCHRDKDWVKKYTTPHSSILHGKVLQEEFEANLSNTSFSTKRNIYSNRLHTYNISKPG